MESALLFFMAGLFMFAVKQGFRQRKPGARFLAFLGTGVLSGLIISFITEEPWIRFVNTPRCYIPLVTGVAGILLYIADEKKLIFKTGIKYTITIVLGGIHALVSYFLIWVYARLAGTGSITLFTDTGLFVVLLLVGFVTMFGYTFPERWFKTSEPEKEKDA
jgi:hypothetical protein